MPSLNYRPWKARKVESGECRQTIRPQRKRPFRVGDRLIHYEGMRTKECRKLGESVCTKVVPISINRDFVCMDFFSGRCLKERERDTLARADGFKDYAEMQAWFAAKHGFPFSGQLIRWGQIEKVGRSK